MALAPTSFIQTIDMTHRSIYHAEFSKYVKFHNESVDLQMNISTLCRFTTLVMIN